MQQTIVYVELDDHIKIYHAEINGFQGWINPFNRSIKDIIEVRFIIELLNSVFNSDKLLIKILSYICVKDDWI